MKLASFIVQGRSTYGVVEGDQVIDLESVKPTFGTCLLYTSPSPRDS